MADLGAALNRSAGGEPERIAVAFVRALRAAGVAVDVGAVVTFTLALGALGIEREQSVYWAGRVALVRDVAEVMVYDGVFEAFWWGRADNDVAPPPAPLTVTLDAPARGGALVVPTEPSGRTLSLRYSPVDALRNKDFAHYSAEEFSEARRLMADLRLAAVFRRSRRLRSGGRGVRPDLRVTVRRALRTGGEPVRRAFLQRGVRPRRVVVICDVSGSMDPYTRAMLRFMHAAVSGQVPVEAFALGTRLTRITRQLSWRDPDAALRAVGRAVADWSGGTRLGEGLRMFNDRWGIRGLARGAVVVILSDGWDRGEPEVLAEQMARLHRVAHRVVWVNPLKVSPGYAPLAGGMAAALPWVDDFVEGHSLAALGSLAGVIARS